VPTLAVRDVCGLRSDGVALWWRGYGCVGMCTAGEMVAARLEGRVEVRECDVEGGVVGDVGSEERGR
jgi:hypothetical protein